ncbi:MAG: hypothetical protein AB8G11_02985, partial [Saprospiraceae bacterium]
VAGGTLRRSDGGLTGAMTSSLIIKDVTAKHELKVVVTEVFVLSRPGGKDGQPKGLKFISIPPVGVKKGEDKIVAKYKIVMPPNTSKISGKIGISFRATSTNARYKNNGERTKGKDYMSGNDFYIPYTIIGKKPEKKVTAIPKEDAKNNQSQIQNNTSVENSNEPTDEPTSESISSNEVVETQPSTPKEPTTPKETTEDKAYKKAVKINTLIAFQEFVQKYPRSKKYGKKAQQKICKLTPFKASYRRDIEAKKEGKCAFIIDFDGICDIEDFEKDLTYKRLDQVAIKREGSRFVVTIVNEEEPADLTFFAKRGTQTFNDKITCDCGAVYFDVKVEANDNMLSFLDIKGNSDNQALKLKVYTTDKHEIFSKNIPIGMKEVAFKDLNMTGGHDYYIKIFNSEDAQAASVVGENGEPYLVSVPKSYFWHIVIATGILLFIGLFAVWHHQKKRSEAEELKDYDPHNPNNPQPINDDIVILDSTDNTNETVIRPNPNIKSKYDELDLTHIWTDTNVESVKINKTFALKLNEFVFDTNRNIIAVGNGEIPEIGGYLLGYATQNKATGLYQLSVERFVDIEPENNNVYQIKFGGKAEQRLSYFLDAFAEKNYNVIGWFHTHPGHGLFLSNPDRELHNGLFKKPYQVAMELDSVQRKDKKGNIISNEGYDFTFFTRKSNGTLNNKKDNKQNSWFKWENLMGRLKKL